MRFALKGPSRGCCSGHPKFLTQPFLSGHCDVIENAVLSEDFIHSTQKERDQMNDLGTDVEGAPLNKKKTLRPIIFSHDMLNCPTDYIGLISDIVSRGYVVIAPYH
jgi:hypothetical protein